MQKENIVEIRKKSSLPIISPSSGYMKFKKGDIVSVKIIKSRSRFPFIDPKQIMTAVVALMIFAVGVFSFTTIWSSLSDESEFGIGGTTCITVTDPSVQQTVTIPSTATITRVYETLNIGGTQDIDSGNYTFVGTTVTINVTG